MFSVVNGVLLSPLPHPDADHIVRLFQVDSTGKRNNNVSKPNFDDMVAPLGLTRLLEGMLFGITGVEGNDETHVLPCGAGANAVSRR